jgi:hypothetical protein
MRGTEMFQALAPQQQYQEWRFKIVRAVTVKSAVFWVRAPRRLVDCQLRFGGTYITVLLRE